MERDRTWMYNKNKPDRGGLTDEFRAGLIEFMEFARSHMEFMDGTYKFRCPCKKCKNERYEEYNVVGDHLCRRGFTPNYYNWTCHGEPFMSAEEYRNTHQFPTREGSGGATAQQFNPYQTMVIDGAGHNFARATHYHSTHEQGCSSREPQLEIPPDTTQFEYIPETAEFDANLCNEFREVLRSADEPLWDGCDNHTRLSVTARMLNIKAEHNVSENCFNSFVDVMREALPQRNIMPNDFYEMKKLVQNLGLPVIRIDVCNAGCMLFWKADADLDSCKFCGEPRFKVQRRQGRNLMRRPVKQLFYLPLIPRLQRLYASKATAEHMTWHAHHETDEDVMCHPSDAYAWKHFDRTYPGFAMEPRNIRLGLCSDGFAPFGKTGKSYSCWPVILTPYNFPPGMCMKTQYMFLTLIVPGPNNPKKMIDVYMQPLIDELQQLWNEGVPTYDAYRDEAFLLKAALLWTINDFPAYGMLSGWSTAGLLGCPICMEKSKAFRLKHGRKPCYFDCHRQFLSMHHPFRKNQKEFSINRREKTSPPTRCTGQELWERVQPFPTVVEAPHCATYGYGSTHKWTKRSIFWDLPYWKTHILHHNLDVMHIEKNVFENVINTVMDVTGKTKDNLNARKDMFDICDRPTLEVARGSVGPKPKAVYTLSREQRRRLLEWVKSLRFPDGYASNIGRCVDMQALKLTGMKSHDCHVFMERLLPIAMKEFLPSFVWGPLTELSNFFHDLCSTKLQTTYMQKLEKDIPIIMCNLERIFPPAFFDSMEHLLVHLPYEAKVGGPVQFRWMYPFERFLFHLKKKVKNKACVEASICNAYIVEEVTTFASYYFEPNVQCKRRKAGRNDEGPIDPNFKSFSIFNYLGRSSGVCTYRYITGEELRVAHTYILLNCPEIDPYVELFRRSTRGVPPAEFDTFCNQHFAGWLQNYVHENQELVAQEGLLYFLSMGPNSRAKTWPAYFINGYNFHTQKQGIGKSTMNSGICVQSGPSLTEAFYGLLDEIIDIEYPGPLMHVVLFKGTWFDPVKGMRVLSKFNLVEVNHKRKYPKYEPFILAQQAIQVYYASYPSLKRDKADWWAACKIKARTKIELHWKDTAYQQETVNNTVESAFEYAIPCLGDASGVLLDVDVSEIGEDDEEGDIPTDDDEETDDEDKYEDDSQSEDAEDDDDNVEDDHEDDFEF